MCFEEKNDEIKQNFVSLAMEKRVRNKRKRDPDMYVDVLLSSTVKRLKCEIVNKDYYTRKPWKKREMSPVREEKDNDDFPEPIKEEQVAQNEVEIAVECLQSTLETLDQEESYCASNVTDTTNTTENHKNNQSTIDTSIIEDSRTFSDAKLTVESAKYEDIDFDTLMQSLLEICEPLTCSLDELMKEYGIDPNSSGPLDLLSSSDPFLPGMFEVMCS